MTLKAENILARKPNITLQTSVFELPFLIIVNKKKHTSWRTSFTMNFDVGVTMLM